MTLREYLSRHHGAGARLAAQLGVHRIQVSNWATGKRRVPLEHCIPIERATGGAVTCEELRVDYADHFRYLRGLDQRIAA